MNLFSRLITVIFGLTGLWFLLLASPNKLVWSVRWLIPDFILINLMTTPRSLSSAIVALGFAVTLLLFAYRRFHTSSKKTAQYTKRQDGDWFEFDVSPAVAPVLWFPVIMSVVFGAGTIIAGNAYMWVFGLFFASIAALLLLRDQRGGNATSPVSFRVSQEGINTKATFLEKEHIHHLRIKNKYAGDFAIVYDPDQGVPTGVAMGMAGRRALAEVAFRVEVEGGGKAHELAAGLDEVTALGLCAEIGKALQ
ncbi:hypothetical protein ACW73L_19070 [Methylolobus aquaticus]